MSKKEFPPLNKWMEEKYAFIVYIFSLTVLSFFLLTSLSVLFNPFSLFFTTIVSIFLIVLIPLFVTYSFMTPFYLLAEYRFKRREELRRIFRRLRFHPDESIEQSMEKASKGSTFWKIGTLVNMWNEINDNACSSVFRGPYG